MASVTAAWNDFHAALTRTSSDDPIANYNAWKKVKVMYSQNAALFSVQSTETMMMVRAMVRSLEQHSSNDQICGVVCALLLSISLASSQNTAILCLAGAIVPLLDAWQLRVNAEPTFKRRCLISAIVRIIYAISNLKPSDTQNISFAPSSEAVSSLMQNSRGAASQRLPLFVDGKFTVSIKLYTLITTSLSNPDLYIYPKLLSQITSLFFVLLSTTSVPPSSESASVNTAVLKKIRQFLPQFSKLCRWLFGKLLDDTKMNASKTKSPEDDVMTPSTTDLESCRRLFAIIQRIVAQLAKRSTLIYALIEAEFPSLCALGLPIATADAQFSSLFYNVQALISLSQSRDAALAIFNALYESDGLVSSFSRLCTPHVKADPQGRQGDLFKSCVTFLLQLHQHVLLSPGAKIESQVALYDVRACSYFVSNRALAKQRHNTVCVARFERMKRSQQISENAKLATPSGQCTHDPATCRCTLDELKQAIDRSYTSHTLRTSSNEQKQEVSINDACICNNMLIAPSYEELCPEFFITMPETSAYTTAFLNASTSEVSQADTHGVRTGAVHAMSNKPRPPVPRRKNRQWTWAPTEAKYFDKSVESVEPLVSGGEVHELDHLCHANRWVCKRTTTREHKTAFQNYVAFDRIAQEMKVESSKPASQPQSSVPPTISVTVNRPKTGGKKKIVRSGGRSRVASARADAKKEKLIKPIPVSPQLKASCLSFSSDFECGNLARAIRVGVYEYDLILNHDINSSGHTQWFFFSVANTECDVPYKFNIVNFYKSYSAWNKGMRPVMFSNKEWAQTQTGWHRMKDVSAVCYTPSLIPVRRTGTTPARLKNATNWLLASEKDKERLFSKLAEDMGGGKTKGRRNSFDKRGKRGSGDLDSMRAKERKWSNSSSKSTSSRATESSSTRRLEKEFKAVEPDSTFMTMTFTTTFQHSQDKVFLSHSYPYSHSMLREDLNALSATAGVRAREHANIPPNRCMVRQPLCYTPAGNMCELLTVTNFDHKAEVESPMAQRQVVAISARVHPGETNSSWVLRGFLHYLCGPSNHARRLRSTFVFKIVPMLNPDGVIEGNYRLGLAGQDLNRHWQEPDRTYHPSIYHTKSLVRALGRPGSRKLLLYVDIHGHSSLDGFCLYGCTGKPQSYNLNPRTLSHEQLTQLLHQRSFLFEAYEKAQAAAQASELSRQLEMSEMLIARDQLFVNILQRRAPHLFNINACTNKMDKSKAGSARVVLWKALQPRLVNCFTLETSFYGVRHGPLKGKNLTTRHYAEIGELVLLSILDLAAIDKLVAQRFEIN